MNVSPAMATSGKFSRRLPNSIQGFSVVWPAARAATALLCVHLGQSGQPRPDDDRRTAAPVEMTIALASSDASAQPRSILVVGRHTRAISRESTRIMLTLRSRRARADRQAGVWPGVLARCGARARGWAA